MIKNLIGYAIGSSVSKSAPVAGGTTGAMIASAVPFVVSRMSIPTMIALGVGGYLIKRHLDKGEPEAGSTDTASPGGAEGTAADVSHKKPAAPTVTA